RPRRGVAGRDLAGVAETGFHRRPAGAVDHDHLVAGLAQVPGAGHADHAGAEDQDAHACARVLPPAGRARAGGRDPVAAAPGSVECFRYAASCGDSTSIETIGQFVLPKNVAIARYIPAEEAFRSGCEAQGTGPD